MYSIVYVSTATRPFPKSELLELLEVCKRNNAAKGITGMLLHWNGSFLQVLEGEKDSVDELYNKIAKDSRHRSSVIILRSTTEEREFGEWSMGLRDESPELASLSEFNTFFREPSDSPAFNAQAGVVRRMLGELRSTFLR